MIKLCFHWLKYNMQNLNGLLVPTLFYNSEI